MKKQKEKNGKKEAKKEKKTEKKRRKKKKNEKKKRYKKGKIKVNFGEEEGDQLLGRREGVKSDGVDNPWASSGVPREGNLPAVFFFACHVGGQ